MRAEEPIPNLPFQPPSPALVPSPRSAMPAVLLGSSGPVLNLRAQLRRIGPHFRTALLTGEVGCGEEAIARHLHELSALQDRPFVSISGSRAELRFVPTEGPVAAFTEGTLYFPEIVKLSRAAQEGLLRLLRARTPQTPRIVAFAPRGLRAFVSAGTFSSELAGHLEGLRLTLAPLRERTRDIPILLQHLFKTASGPSDGRPLYLTQDFVRAAVNFPWPGNLDQMETAARWLVDHAPGGALRPADLQSALDAIASSARDLPNEVRLVRLEIIMQEHIRSVLLACNGNKLRASEILGISRSTLYRMLEAPGIPENLALAG